MSAERSPISGPSESTSRADCGGSRSRSIPISRASASTATASTATAPSATASPIASHVSVERSTSGTYGTAANAAARTRLRATASQPIREPAPKQGHGRPERPARIATASRDGEGQHQHRRRERRSGEAERDAEGQPELEDRRGHHGSRRECAAEAERPHVGGRPLEADELEHGGDPEHRGEP